MKKTYIIPAMRMTQLNGMEDMLIVGSPKIPDGPNMKHGVSITDENMGGFQMDSKEEADWASGW